MRLIDANELKDRLKEYCIDGDTNAGYWYSIMGIDDCIDNAPTIDAVEVVRCKECEYWTKQSDSLQGRCALSGSYPTGAWYCANSERREDE